MAEVVDDLIQAENMIKDLVSFLIIKEPPPAQSSYTFQLGTNYTFQGTADYEFN